MGGPGKVGGADTQVVDRPALGFQGHLFLVQRRKNLIARTASSALKIPSFSLAFFKSVYVLIILARFAIHCNGSVDGGSSASDPQHGSGHLGPGVVSADAVCQQPVSPLEAQKGIFGHGAEDAVDAAARWGNPGWTERPAGPSRSSPAAPVAEWIAGAGGWSRPAGRTAGQSEPRWGSWRGVPHSPRRRCGGRR